MVKSIVAVEITRKIIRAAEVSGYTTNNPKLLRYSEIVLPDNLIDNSDVKDSHVVADYLKDLWKKAGFTTKHAVIGLSSFRITTRKHDLPIMDSKSLKKVLPFEAANIMPGQQVENSILDFYPIKKNDEDNTMTGLIIAVSLETVQRILTAFTLAEIEVDYVDFTPFATVRSIRRFIGATGQYVVVNVSPSNSEIIAVKNGTPERLRIVSEGASVRTEDKYLKDTEETDSENGYLGEEQAFEVEDTIDLLINTIKRTIEYCTDKDNLNITNVYITGEGSLSDELVEKMVPILELPTQRIELDQVINQPSEMNEEDKDIIVEASIISTVGLAMRGLK